MPILVNAYCTHRNPPVPQFPHVLNARRGREDAELPPHLHGFFGYVLSRGGEQMTAVKYHLMRHIQRVRHQFSMTVETADLEAFGEWAQAANAIAFFPDGSILDCQGRVLLDAEGQTEKGAGVPYPEDARERKTRSDGRLRELGIAVPESLPPVIGETEVDLRPAGEVAQRAMALFLAALRAEVIASGSGPSVDEMKERLPLAFAGLSPAETAFLAAPQPDEKEINVFGWRYETLLALQWALGLAPDLPHPTGICDVPAVASRMLEANGENFAADAVLRPASDILDALDLHYRLHWAVRQARLDNKPVPGGIEGGVVYERHYALNWLVRFEDAEWDAVETPS
jgi:hypothetical protein